MDATVKRYGYSKTFGLEEDEDGGYVDLNAYSDALDKITNLESTVQSLKALLSALEEFIELSMRNNRVLLEKVEGHTTEVEKWKKKASSWQKIANQQVKKANQINNYGEKVDTYARNS